jgi:uncharacterized membrane protein
MSNNLHNELRKEFQLERLILFSDAVFAIAITLLVIEIKIPEIPRETLTENSLLQALAHLIPNFLGFLISFLLIGQYWIVHHRIFGYVINFSERLIWLNILFLLAIALMPFSTRLYGEYVLRPVITPVVFYTANIAMLGIVNFFMWRYISNAKNKISENLTPVLAKYFSLRALTVPVIFIIFSFVYLYSPMIAFPIPMLIPFIMRLIFNPMKKKIIKTLN